MTIRFKLAAILAFACALALCILWTTDIPLGVPGEWTWSRHDYGEDGHWHVIVELAVAAIAGAALLKYSFAISRSIERLQRRRVIVSCVGLVMLSWVWIVLTQRCTPPTHSAIKSTWVLFDPGASGYFTQARGMRGNIRGFLATYEKRMQRGDVLHEGTHPPGLAIVYAAAINTCEASPLLTDAVLWTMPFDRVEAFREVERHAALGAPLERFELAALWLGGLLADLAVAVTILPIFWLVRRWSSRQSAWNACAWWPLIPSVMIFLPKSDALYPVIGVTFLLLCDLSMTSASTGRRVSCGLGAGAVVWLGLCLSLAMLPILLAAASIFAWNAMSHEVPSEDADDHGNQQSQNDHYSTAVISGVAILAGVVSLIAIAWSVWSLNLPRIWQLNLQNHSGFYEQFTRTYWKWLIVNPLELLMAIGLPLAIALTVRVRNDGQLRDVATASSIDSNLLRARIVFAAVWGLLWLSGKNSGEAARLWIIFMPWLVIALGRFRPDPQDNANWRYALIAQLLVCLATVSRVSGFQF